MEDRNRNGWPDLTLKNLIESLSLVTAIGFVFSGFLNWVRFWWSWELSFFQVAQPSDIVMSGFVYIGGMFLVILPLLLGFAVWKLFRAMLAGGQQPQEPDPEPEELREELSSVRTLLFRLVIFAAVFTGLGQLTGFKGRFSQPPPRPEFIDREVIVLTKKSDLADLCGAADVEWLGSSTAVVRCHGEVVVAQLDKVLPVTLITRRERF